MKYKITSAGTIENNWPFQVHDYVEVFFSKFLPDVPVLNNNTVIKKKGSEEYAYF